MLSIREWTAEEEVVRGKTCTERRSGQGHVKVISALRDLLEPDEETAVARRFVGVEMELETLSAGLELHYPCGGSEGVTRSLSSLFSVSGRKQKRYKARYKSSLYRFFRGMSRRKR